MNINKVDAIWLAAVVNTYEVCKTKPDWELSDIYFKQAKIVLDAKNMIKDEIPATFASRQCCAQTAYTSYRYLVAKDTSRRISYSGEVYFFEDDDNGEALSVWDAADIYLSKGFDEDYRFGYTHDQLMKALGQQ